MQDDRHDFDSDTEAKTKWAEDRTDWAEDRTLQANERTFAGWMRTGLGAVGVALGLKAVFGDFDPTWTAKAVASIFVIVALFLFHAAWRNAAKTHDRLSDHAAETPSPRHFGLIAAAMAAGAVGTGAVLWML